MKTTATALLLVLLGASTLMAQKNETGFLNRTVTVDGFTLPYVVYVPATYDPHKEWPVILFLHGAGERGSDGLKQTQVGIATALRMDMQRYPALIVMPQTPTDSAWTGLPARAAMAALDVVTKDFRTDPNRVYLTGLSMGGKGTWYLAYRYPDRFAAVAPICGWISNATGIRLGESVVPDEDGDPFAAVTLRLQKLPIWIFHGEVDPSVPVGESRRAFAALKAAAANVRYTEYLGTGHNSWDPTYASVEFTNWLFAQRRGAVSYLPGL